MKPPYFKEIERKIMKADDSLFASRMRLFIAVKYFEKSFMKSYLGGFLRKTLDQLNKLLPIPKKTN